jgi:hypothetical protein
MWRRFLSWLTGRPIVVLIDMDGEINFRLAFLMGRNFYARRVGFGIRTVRLLEDGTVEGGAYCKRWRFA